MLLADQLPSVRHFFCLSEFELILGAGFRPVEQSPGAKNITC